MVESSNFKSPSDSPVGRRVPRQRRAEDTRSAIVTAAAEVFGRNGYTATSLNEIVRAANLTQGALYFHFDSKAALANEVVRLQHQKSIAAGIAYMPDAGSGVAAMIRLSIELAEQITLDPVVRAGLRLSTEGVEFVADAAELPYLEWIQTCRRYLAAPGTPDELRQGIDADAASELIIAAFTGTQFLSAALSSSRDLLPRLHRMWMTLLPALVTDVDHPEIAQACSALAARGMEQTSRGPRQLDQPLRR